ncbi:hypothetical protein BKA58DRAFT_206441 [Alternaria rosae]|uniref:uncharacterized protein n=1 Tax=Alternaria rosae TaxID=1187941 RepID=UPI001E8D1B63|nr:uncharacterized protein BKA58DRAFT_206441 [Alternaria rosae]KAH6866547.1 hypothetical protein BKA58DRAFT_206441 [Alternaria rosae]
MQQEPSSTEREIIFNLTWRYLSHAAVPAMLPASALDANASIPRAFCPEVYDGVRKTVRDMREEGQWAVWYWVVGPGDGEGRDEQKERVSWHPCFRLPANRRVVTRNVHLNTSPTSIPYPNTNTTPSLPGPPPPRRRSISSFSYLSTNPDHHTPNPIVNPIANPHSSHIRRSSADTTRPMSSVREEGRSEEGSRIRKSSSLHVRPWMVSK